MTTQNQTLITAEPGKQELFITRELEAPRDLVFKAFNDPELIVQWLGPSDMSMKIDKFDSRSGGSYRFLHCDAGGNAYGFNGVIHEVAEPERIIRTFEFEGLAERGHVALEFLTMEVLPNDRTKLTIQSVFKSVADRDGLIMSGMERGLNQGFKKLEELLAKKK